MTYSIIREKNCYDVIEMATQWFQKRLKRDLSISNGACSLCFANIAVCEFEKGKWDFIKRVIFKLVSIKGTIFLIYHFNVAKDKKYMLPSNAWKGWIMDASGALERIFYRLSICTWVQPRICKKGAQNVSCFYCKSCHREMDVQKLAAR